MHDIVSIARRLQDYAAEPANRSQKREDLLNAAAALLTLHAMLNAKAETEVERNMRNRRLMGPG